MHVFGWLENMALRPVWEYSGRRKDKNRERKKTQILLKKTFFF